MTDFAQARTTMVDCQVRPSDVTLYPIIAAMLAVPREEFVPRDRRSVAYADEAISLGPGRVILAPRTMGKLLDALAIAPDELVLDIGCGCGYSAALIGRLAEAVVAVEEDEAMAQAAGEALARQSIDNAVVHTGPLAKGADEHGPYDVIMVQGGVVELPEAIADQLKEGGRIGMIGVDGPVGRARIGLKSGGRIAWRTVFDATAPVLPGFAADKEFVF